MKKLHAHDHKKENHDNVKELVDSVKLAVEHGELPKFDKFSNSFLVFVCAILGVTASVVCLIFVVVVRSLRSNKFTHQSVLTLEEQDVEGGTHVDEDSDVDADASTEDALEASAVIVDENKGDEGIFVGSV
jgi:cobalamin synthase